MMGDTLTSEAPLPDTPEEHIGSYRVHPVAAMFPLLEGEEYEDLKSSIESYGLQRPIVVQNGILIDGRNRLKICLEIQLEPRFAEYRSQLDPADYIRIANIHRRHLTEDMRNAIGTQIYYWKRARAAATKQIAAGAAQGHHGIEGGRGHKKPLRLNSDEGVHQPHRNTVAENERSTAGQIAADTKTSRYKALQSIAIAKAAPDLLQQVSTGAVKLKTAHAQIKNAAAPRPPKPRKASAFNVQKKAETCLLKMSAWIAQCPAAKRPEFKELLLKECKRLCEK